MEFREDNWANLVYISSFVYPKTQEEVAENWELENPEKVLSPTVKAELERLTQVRIIKHAENGYKANLKSQSFKTEVRTFLSKHEDWSVPEDFNKYIKFLKRKENRKELLKAERIRHYYSKQPDKARKNPVMLFAETIEIMQKKDSGLPIDESHNTKLAATIDQYYSGL